MVLSREIDYIFRLYWFLTNSGINESFEVTADASVLLSTGKAVMAGRLFFAFASGSSLG
ncbi:hypothetical protein [Cecembia rubra]|uniref:hypothetical protein n=1 Tax=Cecembia rubra TaxID=1485585 RepID=UPI0027154F12|nr:hypothetical protein [Cecembia rubra]